MKTEWRTVEKTLDQLFFMPLMVGETPEARDEAIQTWIAFCGWKWQDVIDHMVHECMSE